MPLDRYPSPGAGALPRPSLVLAVAQAQRGGHTIEDTQMRLWRESPEEVATIFASVEATFLGQTPESGAGLLAERIRQVMGEARRSAPKPRGGRGLTLEQVADLAGVDRATLVALMEHHGFLELAQHGRDQRRRLVTDATVAVGLGHNVQPGGKRVAALEGYDKAAPFPVFYEDRLAEVLWVLDLDGIRREAAQREDRGKRLEWLLDRHGYLPGAELARISGYSLRSVRAAQAARTALASYREVGLRGDYAVSQ